METKDDLKLSGEWLLVLRNIKTKEKKVVKIKNQLTNLYRNEIIKLLNGNGESVEIKYLAVGTGSTQATASDVKLETEILRRMPTLKTVATNYLQSSLVLLPADANVRIREIGVFFGASATSTADSGKLLSRINVDIEKTSSEELFLIRKDFVNI